MALFLFGLLAVVMAVSDPEMVPADVLKTVFSVSACRGEFGQQGSWIDSREDKVDNDEFLLGRQLDLIVGPGCRA